MPKPAKAPLAKNCPSKARPAVGCTGDYLQAHEPWKAKHAFVAAHWKHGRRSRAFTEARKQIWADLRAIGHSHSIIPALQTLVFIELIFRFVSGL